MNRKSRTLIGLLAVLCVVLMLGLPAFVPESADAPPPETAPTESIQIVIEHAATSWRTALAPSPKLVGTASKVLPRILIEHAATSTVMWPVGSAELARAAGKVTPRIMVQHAATSSLMRNLQRSEALIAATQYVAPRIMVSHAAAARFHPLEEPQPDDR